MNKQPDPKRFYWDSCVFLAGINGEEGRSEIVAQLLEDADNGRCVIFTSHLSVAEVAYGVVEQVAAEPSVETEENIDALWHPTSPVKLVEIDYLVALDARK